MMLEIRLINFRNNLRKLREILNLRIHKLIKFHGFKNRRLNLQLITNEFCKREP